MELIDISKINTKTVAFDFFDTVVHRDCHPEEILYQWSKQMAFEMKFEIYPSILYDLRKNVEKTYKNSGIEEIEYDTLLSSIYRKIENQLETMSQKEFIEKAKIIELNIELQHIYLDSEILEALKFLKKESKRIILVSDFYTDKKLIEEILRKFKILDYFSEIYISSEKSYRKSTGNLYKLLLKELELSPEDVTMIGDNFESDYEIPKSLGLKAIHRKYEDTYTITGNRELARLYKQILFGDSMKAPFNVFLADIVFFISELHKRLVKDGVQTALFCSREGQLLKQLFDIYQNIFFYENQRIKTEYFYVSRRSTLYPSFTSLEDEKFEIIFRQYKKMTIQNFLLNLNFTDNEITSITQDMNREFTDILTIDSKLLLDLKAHPVFISRFNKEKEDGLLLRNYVEALTPSQDEIYIVDVGWKGTIQDSLQRAVPNKKIVGYYLGLILNEYSVQNKDNKFGMLFSDYPNKSPFFDIVSRNFGYYEDIFVADHGPTLKYKQEEMIVPVLDENEKHVKIYRAVQNYQKQMVEGFIKIAEAYKNLSSLPFEQMELWLTMSLKKECVHLPKLLSFSRLLKEQVAENFGEIVTKNIAKKSLKRLIKEKKNFFWVDFAYKPFFGTNFLFIPELYTRLIYLIKYTDLKLRLKKYEE
ncbi:HAD hydrolase, family IA, variant 1 [Streptococcus cristatus ATCC 51100]|uniref:HAD hydrolase, family IA, variant 1 n=2 Tax=Streptococcus cristatus TaxID=45634 RepID=A0AAV3EGJ1_STRCR|nr:HAD-IA family hydrolase [Streptococcus cristatus]EFX52318.1 HAD hydrolase, family IA, variant 1 [Streptococcus cristatus ATCC 51100]EGU68549.1 HAD hydrolase, family IA, variant 1 [Streptococcus cristatus ATCC 51100]KJQ60530.1 haloacid dehalogenase-like hydrolase [Streptococcus cristatus]SQG33152.1 putative phosphotransferase [Streptococcus cristatus ATCC 51100]